MNITEFLEARIAEDEAVARAATRGPWEVEAGDAGHSRYEMNVWVTEKSVGDVVCDMDGLARSYNERYDNDGYTDAAHIVRHDPARVLAECAAKRAVLEMHRLYIHTDEEPGFSMTLWECMCNRQTGKPCPTVGALAAVYADHPDYREEWAL